MPERNWRSERVYTSGDPYFDDLAIDLEAAKRSIDIEVFIFEDDALGHQIARKLREAAQRGVRVRIMVDGFGSPGWSAVFSTELGAAGVQMRIFHPLWFPKLSGIWRWLSRLNLRNHRKVCIVDGDAAWVGSMNVIQNAWRDTGVRVEGEDVAYLGWAFERAWRSARTLAGRRFRWRWRWPRRRTFAAPRLADASVRINATKGQRLAVQQDLLRRICSANRRVWITNAYFVPNRHVRAALEAAAAAGVDVRILVPQNPDVPFIRAVSLMLYFGLLRAGVTIYEFLPRVLHSKTMLIDDWATVGSTNLNHRSLIHDLEADVVLSEEKSKDTLERAFLNDLTHARLVTLADWRHRPWLERLFGRMFLALRYWI